MTRTADFESFCYPLSEHGADVLVIGGDFPNDSVGEFLLVASEPDSHMGSVR
ncbi:MAG: hypothetical protein RJA31_661 [Actinomycetota bacterium]